jgi:hypothetical protein
MSDSLDQLRDTLRAYRESLEKLAAVLKESTRRRREFNERMEARLAEIDAKSADTTRHGQHSD